MSDIVPASEIAEARIRRFEAEGLEPWRSFLIEHPDGVYVSLPELDYLNDYALSYSAFKLLNSNPPDYFWESPFNVLEDKVRKSTPALRFGSALHALLLEGEEALEAGFFVPPDKKDKRWKDYARTVDDVKDKIKALGVTPKGTKKEHFIDQLLELDPKAKLFDALVDEWRGAGRVEITADQMVKLKLMKRLADVHPEMKVALSGVGLAEVSCFWTSSDEDPEGPGIRQRMRLDRAKPKASVDLKSFSNWQGRDFRQALLREATLRAYHVQTNHYDVGRGKARELIDQGKVYFCEEVLLTEEEIEAINAERQDEEDHIKLGEKRTVYRTPTPEEMELVKAVFTANDEWAWFWIFYKTDGAPTAQLIRCDRDTLPMREGDKQRRSALSVFRHYVDQFGLEPGKLWLRMDGMWTPDDSEWPRFMDTEIA